MEREDSRAKKVAAETAHSVFIETTTLLWVFYRHLLAKPARLLVPDHTREAFFQAFCDIRTNSPKDRRWLKHHWKALQPHTANGWLALSASVLLAGSGLAGLLCLTTAILTLALYSALAVTALAGIATGTILTTLSVTMVVAAVLAAAGAATLGWAYTVVEVTHHSLDWTNTNVLQPSLQYIQSPSSPRQSTISRSASPRQSSNSKPTTEPASLHAVERETDYTPATSTSDNSTITDFSSSRVNGNGHGGLGGQADDVLLSKSIAGEHAAVAESTPYSGKQQKGGAYPEAKGVSYGS